MVGKKCATCKFYPGDKMVCKKSGMKVDQYDWCHAWRKSTPLTIMDRQAVAEHVKELEEELEKYKKAWAMVPEFYAFQEKVNGFQFGEYKITRFGNKSDIARECGLEVE